MYLLLLNFYKLKGTKLDSTKPSLEELSIFRDELIKDADTVDFDDVNEKIFKFKCGKTEKLINEFLIRSQQRKKIIKEIIPGDDRVYVGGHILQPEAIGSAQFRTDLKQQITMQRGRVKQLEFQQQKQNNPTMFLPEQQQFNSYSQVEGLQFENEQQKQNYLLCQTYLQGYIRKIKQQQQQLEKQQTFQTSLDLRSHVRVNDPVLPAHPSIFKYFLIVPNLNYKVGI